MHALEQGAGERIQQDAGAKPCRTSLLGRAFPCKSIPCKSSLTKPRVKTYSVRLGWLLGKARLFGASDEESEYGSSRPDRAASWCRTPERLAESLAGACSVRLVLPSPPREARWNVCFVTRESV